MWINKCSDNECVGYVSSREKEIYGRNVLFFFLLGLQSAIFVGREFTTTTSIRGKAL